LISLNENIFMDKETIILKTITFAKNFFEGEGSGHDWWHTERVWKTAKYLAQKENTDFFVVEMAALLHDVADWKLNNGDEKAGLQKVKIWLEENEIENGQQDHILEIIDRMSFSKEKEGKKINTIEGFVVQDADRLDAIGAIGIARTFAFGGNRNRKIHDPNCKPEMITSFEQYKNRESTSINHFHEKILLLKDLLNTQTAKEIGEKRHKFVEEYLEQFSQEWECKF
jgi:uncharacterized protein